MKEKQKSVSEIQEIISNLRKISPLHISTAKIKSISERNNYLQKYDYSTEIDEFSQKQLSMLSQLLPQKNALRKDGVIL